MLESVNFDAKSLRCESHKSRRPSACLLLQFPEPLSAGTSHPPLVESLIAGGVPCAAWPVGEDFVV